VAIGVAPVLFAVAPCPAMCAVGLCMKRTAGKLESKSGNE
jgi:hypothetical protein